MNPTSFKAAVDAVFLWALQTSFYATALIALVLLVQFVFRRKLPARWRYALGLLVMARLALPVAPASSLSIFNLAKHSPPPPPPRQVQIATLMTEPTPMESPVALVPDAGELTPSGWVPERPPRVTIGSLAGIAWLAGCLGMLAVAGRRYFSFKSASGSWGTVTEPRVLELLGECKARLGVGRSLRVLNAPGLDTPALFGHWRPVLLLPAEISQRLGDRELRHILLHELVHLKRGDVLVNWAMIVVRALHWFNPAVWLAFRRLRADQELACDAAVMHVLAPDERRDYGNTLIRVLEEFSAARPCPGMVPLVPFFSRKQTIQRRIVMIANFKPAGRGAAAVSIATIVVLGFLTFTRAAEKRSGAGGADLAYRDPWGNPYIITTPTASRADQFDHILGDSVLGGNTVDTAQQPHSYKILSQSINVEPRNPAANSSKNELDAIDEKIRAVQANLQEMRTRMGVANNSNEGTTTSEITDYISSLNATRISAQSELLKTEALLQELQKMDTTRLRDTLPRISPEPLLSSLTQDLMSIESRLAALRSDMGPDHPDVKRAEAARGQLLAQIQAQTKASLSALQTRIDVARAQAERAEKLVAQAKDKSLGQSREYQLMLSELNRLEAGRDALDAKMTRDRFVAASQTDAAVELPFIVMAEYKMALDRYEKSLSDYEHTRSTYPAGSPLLDASKQRVAESRSVREKMEATYPELKKVASPRSNVQPVVVTIGKDGFVHVDGTGTAVAFDSLTMSFREAAAKGPRASMIIEADKDTKFDSLKEIVDAARAAGIGSITLRGVSPK